MENAQQSVPMQPKVPPFMAVACALSEVLNNNHRNDNVHDDLYMSFCYYSSLFWGVGVRNGHEESNLLHEISNGTSSFRQVLVLQTNDLPQKLLWCATATNTDT